MLVEILHFLGYYFILLQKSKQSLDNIDKPYYIITFV